MEGTVEWNADVDGDGRRERNVLVEQHLRLVHHVARQVMAVGSRSAEFEELVSAGTVGLIEAVEKYDPSRGLAFSTFAAPRIRGAILDDCRRQDHVPRSVRTKQRKIRRAEESLAQKLGRAPDDVEVARELDVDLDRLWKWRSDVQGAAWHSLDQSVGDEDATSLAELLEGDSGDEVEADITQAEELRLTREAMDRLNEQQQTVLGLYYFEELNLRQIAGVMGVTESRISQIRTKALSLLRARLSPLRKEAV
jgi:RNA polymerase sigma factor for flagellar operon FliA